MSRTLGKLNPFSGPACKRQRQTALRPSFESLEKKLVLSTFTQISLGSAANRSSAVIDPAFPTGLVTFGGVPFSIPTTGNNIVWDNVPYGPSKGTIVKDFPVGVAGVTQVHTLINTAYGQAGPNSYLSLEFIGSAGADFKLSLIGNVNIRDYNNWVWTNSINNTSTVNVYNNPSHTHRIDMQNITLPAAFATQTLTNIKMIDTGGYLFQRAILYGITVSSTSTVYQNTTNPTGGGFLFPSAMITGNELTTNININELTLAAGSAGFSITTLNVIAHNFNATTVKARPTMYVWAADGAGGEPHTLLGDFNLPITTFVNGVNTSLSLAVPNGSLIVPGNLTIWVGLGFDNDNGATPITTAQLSDMGAPTYHAAAIGTDGPQAYFIPFGLPVTNPAVIAFGPQFKANFGWDVTADPAPDIVMDMATTTDHSTVTATYDINSLPITQPLTFNIYRSAKQGVYTAADLIGTDTLSSSDTADLSAGHHQVKLSVYYASDLAPDPHLPFIIVVANPGKTVQEQNYTNDTTYFRKWLIGVVTHGYDDDNPPVTPQWETAMANDLLNVDGYKLDGIVITFNWVSDSSTKAAGKAVLQGLNLQKQVADLAAPYESGHAGDVVDFHFIGHSRGSVVISQAILDLAANRPEVIRGSYIRMTMLDPHPAANYSTPYYSAGSDSISTYALGKVLDFQKVAVDPSVVVPNVVSYAEVFYQNSSYRRFPGLLNSEGYVNLWGHGNDGSIINKSSITIAYHDLTPKTLKGGAPIGHSEVHDYYQQYVVDTGLSLTYT